MLTLPPAVSGAAEQSRLAEVRFVAPASQLSTAYSLLDEGAVPAIRDHCEPVE